MKIKQKEAGFGPFFKKNKLLILKMGHPRPLFRLFSSLKTNKQQIVVKKVHSVYRALDQGSKMFLLISFSN